MASATLTSKWQMVIPRTVREHLGVHPGDQVEFIIQPDGQVLVRPAVLDVRDLKGILSRPGRKAVSVEQMNRAIRRRAGGRVTGLDTNVLIRYLTQDDPAQVARASRVIETAAAGDLFISAIVLCEAVWVLEDAYHQKREEIAGVIERILLTGQFVFDDKDLLWQALAGYRHQKGDFADHVIGRTARQAGSDHTLTFDRGLKNSELFKLL